MNFPWMPEAGLWDRLQSGDVSYLPLYCAAVVAIAVIGLNAGREPLQKLILRTGVIRDFLLFVWARFVYSMTGNQVKAGSLERNISCAVRIVTKLGLVFACYLTLAWAVSQARVFYMAHLTMILGFFVIFFLFMLPQPLKNIRTFVLWWDYQWRNHFNSYPKDFFRNKGIIMSENYRAGPIWVVRFFPRVLPFCMVLFLACLGYWIVMSVWNRFSLEEILGVLGLLLLSISPVLVGEITRGAQGSKPYFPGFTGILIFISATLYRANEVLPEQILLSFWASLGFLIAVNAVWNFWVFIDDIWPARMAPCWLARTLGELGIKKVYTYDTPYNNAFVNVSDLGKYDITYIRSLSEIQEGYVVVPGTSSKASNMDTEGYAIRNGDFNEDPLLTRLIETQEIKRYAVASFKTFGTSRIFVHESDIASYRDLILKDIDEMDRWRGRAWILDVGKLRSSGALNSQL
jgi:hypothetical protein